MSGNFRATWRGAANEPDAHQDQFDPAIMLIREPVDHAANQPASTVIAITVTYRENDVLVSVFNNGAGITEEGVQRFLSWGSDSSSNGTNVYGQGTKKAFTKGCPDYDRSEWYTEHRNVGDEAGIRFVAPYLGKDTKRVPKATIPVGVTNCWNILHERLSEILRTNPFEMRNTVERLIRTRYPQEILLSKRWIIKVLHNGKEYKSESFCNGLVARSNPEGTKDAEWCSYEHAITAACTWGMELTEGIVNMRSYYLPEALKDPIWGDYGKIGGQRAKHSLVSIATNNVVVELTHYADVFRREPHNEWGRHWKWFVNFGGPGAPCPCTTKVQYNRTTPEWEAFRDVMNSNVKELHPFDKQDAQPVPRAVSNVPCHTWFKPDWLKELTVTEENGIYTLWSPDFKQYKRVNEFDALCMWAGFIVPKYAQDKGLSTDINNMRVQWVSRMWTLDEFHIVRASLQRSFPHIAIFEYAV